MRNLRCRISRSAAVAGAFAWLALSIGRNACAVNVRHSAAAPQAHAARHKSRVPSAAQLYDLSRDADANYSYRGRQVTSSWKAGKTLAITVSHRAGGWDRIDYTAPDRLRGHSLVSNGRQEWQLNPQTKTLTVRAVSPRPNDATEDATGYNLLRSNYTLSLESVPETFANRKAFVLTITRKSNHTIARRLWIDAATNIVLRREVFQEDGRLAVTVAFTEIDFHPKFAPDAFSIPGMRGETGIRTIKIARDPEQPIDIRAVAGQLDRKAIAPPNPAGYRLIGAGVLPYKANRTALHLRYSDGLNLVSLFETQRILTSRPTRVPAIMHPAHIAGVNVNVTHHGSLTTINWDTKSLNLTLMGEAAGAPLKQFVATIGAP